MVTTQAKAALAFEEWMRKVDIWVGVIAGLSVYDLDDCLFADWFEDGVPVRTAARRAIRESGGDC